MLLGITNGGGGTLNYTKMKHQNAMGKCKTKLEQNALYIEQVLTLILRIFSCFASQHVSLTIEWRYIQQYPKTLLGITDAG